MLFPSQGTPTIKVSFATAEGNLSYAYTATEKLPANHHFTISGNYTGQGIALTGVLTASDWGEDRTITFDFNDNQLAGPVARQKYQDYYVVSVNNAARTAVLLAKANLDKITSADFSNSSALYAIINDRMSALALPADASGQWRLPTSAEVSVFSSDPSFVTFNDDNNSRTYYCDDGDGILQWAYTHRTDDGQYELIKSNSNFNSDIRIRPVIDITY